MSPQIDGRNRKKSSTLVSMLGYFRVEPNFGYGSDNKQSDDHVTSFIPSQALGYALSERSH